MRLVHCLLLVCTLFIFGGSQSDQDCETFDEYDIDPGKDYHYIPTAAGEDGATCCAYCINNLTGCTAYVFVSGDNLCYFKNITDLHLKMKTDAAAKAGIVRQMRSHNSSSNHTDSTVQVNQRTRVTATEPGKTNPTHSDSAIKWVVVVIVIFIVIISFILTTIYLWKYEYIKTAILSHLSIENRQPNPKSRSVLHKENFSNEMLLQPPTRDDDKVLTPDDTLFDIPSIEAFDYASSDEKDMTNKSNAGKDSGVTTTDTAPI